MKNVITRNLVALSLGLLMYFNAALAQPAFCPAVTPNLIAENGVMGVLNTDAFVSSFLGVELRAYVRDGSGGVTLPSLTLIYGAPGTPGVVTGTAPILGAFQGIVTDPHIIISPTGNGIFVVVYLLSPFTGGPPDVFVEAYQITPLGAINTILAPSSISQSGGTVACSSPSIDVDVTGQYVISWVEGNRLLANVGSIGAAAFTSINIFDVSASTPILNPPALAVNAGLTQQDVAIDGARINFVYTGGASQNVFLTSTTFNAIQTTPGSVGGETVLLRPAPNALTFYTGRPSIHMSPGSAIANIVIDETDIGANTFTVQGWSVNTAAVPLPFIPAPTAINVVPGPIGFNLNTYFSQGPSIAASGGCMMVGWQHADNTGPAFNAPIPNGGTTVIGRSFLDNVMNANQPFNANCVNTFRQNALPWGAESDQLISLSGKFSPSGQIFSVWNDLANNQMVYKSVTCGSQFLKSAGKDPAPNFAFTFESVTEHATLNAMPNPFSEAVQFEVYLPENEKAMALDIFSITGRKVASIGVSQLTPGTQKISWDGSSFQGTLTPGVYIVRFTTDQQQMTAKITKY